MMPRLKLLLGDSFLQSVSGGRQQIACDSENVVAVAVEVVAGCVVVVPTSVAIATVRPAPGFGKPKTREAPARRVLQLAEARFFAAEGNSNGFP